MNTRPTLQDLALQAHVNKSTVSRALRDDPRILPETRERIQKMAVKLGYVPDPVLSAHGQQRMKRSHEAWLTVAVLFNRMKSIDLTDAIGNYEAIELFEKIGSKRGYSIEPFNRINYPNSEALAHVLKSRGIRALIIAQEFDSLCYQDFPFNHFTTVAYQQSNPPLPLHTVTDDAFYGVVLAWEKLVAAGYRRIGAALLRHPILIPDDQRRIAAIDYCQNYMSPIGSPLPTYYYKNNWPSMDRLPEWIREHRLDALLVFNQFVSVYLLKQGFRIPGDIALATLIRTDENKHLAGIEYHDENVIEATFDTLDYALKTNQWGIPASPVQHRVQSRWADGPSMPWLTPRSIPEACT
ncbi:MAG: LacI family DNA-binding transcriptional regulator [Verrucomicrobiota bacterium]|nr:LacI family DNA-binding transcriptional regulator [Verrucomicrobiota bacterium]